MALDGTLMFGTGVDNSGFNKGINTLQVAAGTALGNIASEITGKLSELAARIPAEMVESARVLKRPCLRLRQQWA